METKENIIKKIQEFNKDSDIIKLRERYGVPSFFEVMEISRKENHHSTFLKWLFQSKDFLISSKFSPLMGLLDILVTRDNQQNNLIGFVIKSAILNRSLVFDNIRVEKEKVISSFGIYKGSKDRIDIFITCDVKNLKNVTRFEFIIENKVGSSEGDEKLKEAKPTDEEKTKNDEKQLKEKYKKYNDSKQTVRYFLGTNKEDNKEDETKRFYIFLTPLSSNKLDNFVDLDENETCESGEFIQINYQDIIDFIIDPLLVSENLSSRNRVFLKEYLRNLCMPSIEDSKSDNNNSQSTKKGIILMGTQKEDKEIITHIWDKYKDLILNGLFLYYPINIDEKRTRQALFNEAIKKSKIKNLENNKLIKNKYTAEFSIKIDNFWVIDVMKNTLKISNKKIDFEDIIHSDTDTDTVFSDLALQYDFYKRNQAILLPIIKIYADSGNEELGVIIDALSNSRDYKKYVILDSNKKLLCNDNGLNKREIVKTFVTKFGCQFSDSDKKTINDGTGRETVLDKSAKLTKDQMNRRYEKYKWNGQSYEYVKKDDSNFDIYFSNQWGCLAGGDGSFDKFMLMIGDLHFEVLSLEDYKKRLETIENTNPEQ